jgi:hypothetical protein
MRHESLKASGESALVMEEVGGGDADHSPPLRLEQFPALDVVMPLHTVDAVTLALILEGDTCPRQTQVWVQRETASRHQSGTVHLQALHSPLLQEQTQQRLGP